MNDLKNKYVFHQYQIDDEKEIVELLQLVFNGWPRFDLECTPIDHWRWKYTDNPLNTQLPIVSIAKYENEIIGSEHTLPMRMKLRDENIFCGHTGDIAVHPKSRGLGLSGELMKRSSKLRKEAGIQFSYAETRNPLLIKSRARADTMKEFPIFVTHLNRIQDFGKHLHMIGSKNVWMKKLGLSVIKTINRINYLVSSTPFKLDINIYKINIFDDRINVFWEEIKDNYKFIVEITKDYLNWRYCDSRGGKYQIKIAEKEGRILGYIVLRTDRFEKEYPRGYIVDLLTLPERLDIAYALIEDAVRHFDNQGVNIVNYIGVKDHPFERVLKKYGFINVGFKIYMYYDPISIVLDEIGRMSPQFLHFVYGNTDWI